MKGWWNITKPWKHLRSHYSVERLKKSSVNRSPHFTLHLLTSTAMPAHTWKHVTVWAVHRILNIYTSNRNHEKYPIVTASSRLNTHTPHFHLLQHNSHLTGTKLHHLRKEIRQIISRVNLCSTESTLKNFISKETKDKSFTRTTQCGSLCVCSLIKCSYNDNRENSDLSVNVLPCVWLSSSCFLQVWILSLSIPL